MNALYQPSKKDPRRRRLAYATVLIICIFFLDIISGGNIRIPMRSASSFLWSGISSIGNSISQSGLFTSKHNLELENLDLRASLDRFKARDAAYQAMEDENKKLRAFVHLAERSHGITAPVISSLAASPYGTFTIGAGINEGVARDSIVYGAGGFALGTVNESAAHSALVIQYFAPNLSVEVMANNIAFSMTGSGGGNASGKAPRDSILKEGDVVWGKSIGAPVGVIGKVISDASSAYVQVFVRYPENIETLSLVYVERK